MQRILFATLNMITANYDYFKLETLDMLEANISLLSCRLL